MNKGLTRFHPLWSKTDSLLTFTIFSIKPIKAIQRRLPWSSGFWKNVILEVFFLSKIHWIENKGGINNCDLFSIFTVQLSILHILWLNIDHVNDSSSYITYCVNWSYTNTYMITQCKISVYIFQSDGDYFEAFHYVLWCHRIFLCYIVNHSFKLYILFFAMLHNISCYNWSYFCNDILLSADTTMFMIACWVDCHLMCEMHPTWLCCYSDIICHNTNDLCYGSYYLS